MSILLYTRSRALLFDSLYFISASNPNREAVRRADALLQTNYVTSDACDHKCTGPTNAWVVRCLSWKTISVPWSGRDYWHGGGADNSNKTGNNTKYSNGRELNHETHDVSLQNLWSPPFWILSPTSNFISIHSQSLYKLSMIRFVHKVHFDVHFW